MSPTVKNIIIAGISLILLAAIALVVVRSGILNRVRGQVQPEGTPGPLLETPYPTTYPFGTSTPFPLITLPTTSASPRGSALPTSTPARGGVATSPSPVSSASCQYLNAEPRDGTAPLAVKFSAANLGTISGNIREYEFDFGDGGQKSRGTGSSTTYRYENAGTYTATLHIRDAQGNDLTFPSLPQGECQRTIIVRGKPTPVGSPGNTSELPKTGFSVWMTILLTPFIAVGLYLYRKYKLI